jgi:vancomycin resistance protein YoaR
MRPINPYMLASVAALGGAAVVVPLTTLRAVGQEPAVRQQLGQATIRPNVKVGPVTVGGLTQEAAARELRVWWETEKRKKLKLKSTLIDKSLPEMTPGELGVTLDDQASVLKLPVQSLLGEAQAALTGDEKTQFEPVFKSNGVAPKALAEVVAESAGDPRPARVTYSKGAILRRKEVVGFTLDEANLLPNVSQGLIKGESVRVPVLKAEKKVPDEALETIKEVVSEFSTRFSAGNRPRSSNIRLAAEFLDGIVLMPGDRVSYNGVVGRRTKRRGFKEAGVFINGRHDTGVGGGICQVSTTMYNAALFANLKIVERMNHSLPVPYVPLGRDATVDYGNIDLVIENSYSSPIALDSEYRPGRLTFRVLGVKEPGQSVKVIQHGRKALAGRTKTVSDPRLPRGVRRVVEGGTPGQSISSTRIVLKDGVEVKREPLGRSRYGGGPTVIAVGTGAVRPRTVRRPVVRRPVRETRAPEAPPVEAPAPEPEVAPMDLDE